MSELQSGELVATGIVGLDDVLHGGFTPNRLYLMEGAPGSGKTTFALQFLLAGVRRGERTMYVTLSETTEELRASAASHGWTLDGIDIVELTPSEDAMKSDGRYTMFHPSEVELSETTQMVLARAVATQPQRLVFDSLSELRLLAQNPLRYRRQILALKHFFAQQQCTVLFADDRTAEDGEMHLFSLAHGVVSLERRTTEYGSLRRQLQISKLRGQQFREGWHDMRIVRGGVEVFPRLVAAEHRAEVLLNPASSDVPGLDALLGGGLTPGTSTLILGPAGTGKSSIAALYALAAAQRGANAAIFLFEELRTTYLRRCRGTSMDLQPAIDAGRLHVRQVDPAELAPGEFAHAVRDVVENRHAQVVVIDTLNGYLHAMPSEHMLMIHLHELLLYLGQKGIVTILITAQHGLLGNNMGTPVDTSYLADTVLLLRYFEFEGELRQAISVVKKRTGQHERSIRQMRITPGGVEIGEPLRAFRGIMSGIPVPLEDSVPRDR